MSTRLRLSRDYPHGVAVFAVALADPGFHRAKLDPELGGEVTDHDHDPEAGTVRVTVRQPVPPGQVPLVVERLLTGPLVLERTETWTLGPDACHGRVEVVVPRAPVEAAGTVEVVGVAGPAGGCRLTIDVAVTAHVPLLGGGIERAVVMGVRDLTGTEHDRIRAWLERTDGAR